MRQVIIPSDYFFKMARMDYYNWQWALVREFIQNSVDAGAELIQFSFENGYLTVTDDGSGMGLETIENALLTLGGSHKTEESVGGIGKAKEILYFSWPEWEIRTGPLLVEGSGCQYEIKEGQHIRGVISRIRINDLIPNIENILYRYISFCSLPKLKITFNNKPIDDNQVQYGKKIATIDGLGDLYENLAESANGIVVQSHGLYMFSNHSISDKGYVFNIVMPSYECLTANRDGFVGIWNDQFGKMAGKVAVDTESTNIRKEQIIYVQKSHHGGLHQTSHKELLDIVKANRPLLIAIAEHADKTTELVDAEDVCSFMEQGFIVNENIIDKASGNKIWSMIKRIRKGKLLEECLGWYRHQFKEGFIIVSENEIDHNMIYGLYGRETLQMAILWRNIVDFLADQTSIARNYGYGFVFAENTVARCQDGYILFNPRIFEELDWQEASFKMLIAAAEELTHHIGYEYHNESFKCRYTELLEIALRERVYMDDIVITIRKVRKRITK